MDPETRDDLVVVIGFILAAVIVIFYASGDRLDVLAARLRRPAETVDTMEARLMPGVQREISMMEHGNA